LNDKKIFFFTTPEDDARFRKKLWMVICDDLALEKEMNEIV
jgi:hypothetical protein